MASAVFGKRRIFNNRARAQSPKNNADLDDNRDDRPCVLRGRVLGASSHAAEKKAVPLEVVAIARMAFYSHHRNAFRSDPRNRSADALDDWQTSRILADTERGEKLECKTVGSSTWPRLVRIVRYA